MLIREGRIFLGVMLNDSFYVEIFLFLESLSYV